MRGFTVVDGFCVGRGDFQIIFPIEMLVYNVSVDAFRKLALYSVPFKGACDVFVIFASVFGVVFEVSAVFFCVFSVYVVAYCVESGVILVCVGVLLVGVCVCIVSCVGVCVVMYGVCVVVSAIAQREERVRNHGKHTKKAGLSKI